MSFMDSMFNPNPNGQGDPYQYGASMDQSRPMPLQQGNIVGQRFTDGGNNAVGLTDRPGMGSAMAPPTTPQNSAVHNLLSSIGDQLNPLKGNEKNGSKPAVQNQPGQNQPGKHGSSPLKSI